MTFFTKYAPPPSLPTDVGGNSRTRQEFAAECDINRIVARIGAGLAAPAVCPSPVFQDVSTIPDNLQDALELVRSSSELFASLPAKVRDRFANNPSQLFAFVADASNREEAVKLGLIPAPVSTPAAMPETKPE